MAKRSFLFIANIGNSDLGGLKFKDNFFETTKVIFERGNFSGLKAVILEPILKFLKKDYDFSTSKIVLCGTLQRKNHPQDSFYSAEIVKKILLKEFPSLRDEQIEIEKISKNPSDYDQMNKYYRNFILSFKDNINFSETDLIVSITGATPAQNTALLLNGILLFPDNLKAVYLFRGENTPVLLDISQEIYSNIIEKQIDVLEENKLYYPLIKICERWHKFFLNKKPLYDFKYALSVFDFKKADEILKRYPQLKDEIKKEELDLFEKYETFKTLKEQKKLNKDYFSAYSYLLNLLWEDAKRKWEQGEIIDFIGRMYRLSEVILSFLFEKEIKAPSYPIDKNKKGLNRYHLNVKNWLIKTEGAKVRECKECFQKIKQHKECEIKDRDIKNCIKGYLKNRYPKFSNFFEIFEELNKIRNESPIAHGFEVVSKERIENVIKRKNLSVDDIGKFVKNLGKIKKI